MLAQLLSTIYLAPAKASSILLALPIPAQDAPPTTANALQNALDQAAKNAPGAINGIYSGPNNESLGPFSNTPHTITTAVGTILFALALIGLFFGINKLRSAGDDKQKASNGKREVIWSAIAMVLLIAIVPSIIFGFNILKFATS